MRPDARGMEITHPVGEVHHERRLEQVVNVVGVILQYFLNASKQTLFNDDADADHDDFLISDIIATKS